MIDDINHFVVIITSKGPCVQTGLTNLDLLELENIYFKSKTSPYSMLEFYFLSNKIGFHLNTI